MNFNIYNILIISGIIQGFVFTGIVCFNKKYHSKSTTFLVTLIFCYSLSNLMYISEDVKLISFSNLYAYAYIPFASIIAPLIYYYVTTFLYPEKPLSIKEKLLSAPFFIFLILTLFFRFRILLGFDDKSSFNPNYINAILFHEMFSVVYTIIILTVVLKKILNFENKTKTFNKAVINFGLQWLKYTIVFDLIFTIYWAYLTYENIFVTKGETNFYILWIAIALIIYWLGHIGIYKYGIIEERKQIRSHVLKNENPSLKKQVKNEHIIALENLLSKDKLYLDSGITLESIAKLLQLSSSYLSRIINAELEISFTDYLNWYRIEEAKTYLENPEFSKYTIVAIGLEAGFNSRSTFFYVFKKATGKTPLEYQREMRIA